MFLPQTHPYPALCTKNSFWNYSYVLTTNIVQGISNLFSYRVSPDRIQFEIYSACAAWGTPPLESHQDTKILALDRHIFRTQLWKFLMSNSQLRNRTGVPNDAEKGSQSGLGAVGAIGAVGARDSPQKYTQIVLVTGTWTGMGREQRAPGHSPGTAYSWAQCLPTERDLSMLRSHYIISRNRATLACARGYLQDFLCGMYGIRAQNYRIFLTRNKSKVILFCIYI